MFKVGGKSKSVGSDAGRRPKLRVTQGGLMSNHRRTVAMASSTGMVFCGIDVSAATLCTVAQREGEWKAEQREFANSGAGHRQLMGWLRRSGGAVRVTLEATGVYGLDLALALDEAEGFAVEVLNPRKASDFARSLGRSKTDKTDAAALAEYSRRMPFVAWRRPERPSCPLSPRPVSIPI
jgi:transposase